MSYDVYFWARAEGDVEDVLDALADGDVSVLVPDPAVRAFRRDLLARLPHLADVIEPPAGDGTSGDDLHYLLLTLPFPWVEQLPTVLALAAAHEMSGYDPQSMEPIGQAEPASVPDETPQTPPAAWSPARLSGLGVGARQLTRAWALAGLAEEVTFGEAVGGYLLALALHDGAQVDAAEAARFIAEVAAQCGRGVPPTPAYARIGFSMFDVTGYAATVAQGHF